ncbi:Photosystem I assembly protein Ycf3 [Bienertia sinuspersici]
MEILLIRPFQLWPIFYYESFRQPQEKRRHLLITEMKPIPTIKVIYTYRPIHTSNGEHTKALEYYFRALERNPFLPQAFNNMAPIPIPMGRAGHSKGRLEITEAWFDQAAECWKQAITLLLGIILKRIIG